jgi:hypothetical protein
MPQRHRHKTNLAVNNNALRESHMMLDIPQDLGERCSICHISPAAMINAWLSATPDDSCWFVFFINQGSSGITFD